VKKMKVYVDACCWDRRHDDLTDKAIKAEAVAIMSIIDMCQVAGHGIVGSAAVLAELQGIPEADLREDTLTFYKNTINIHAKPTENAIKRMYDFRAKGLKNMDSLHLAIAEAADVDVLLTVDKDFERISTNKKLSTVKVINPLKLTMGGLI